MDVLREHYPVSEEDATVLAALLMQHRWGNYTTDLAALEVLRCVDSLDLLLSFWRVLMRARAAAQ